MRILSVGSLYPPYHLGGYELVWRAAVRALREASHDVRVLVTSDRLGRPPGLAEEPDVHRELRWYWRDHAFPRLGLAERVKLERHNHAVLARHLEAFAPDIVSWWSLGGMSLSLVERVRRSGPPAIGWVNDEWMNYGPRVDQWLHLWSRMGGVAAPLGAALTRLPTRAALDDAARWVFLSEDTRRAALRAHPGLRDTVVRHQGVAADFTPAEQRPWDGRILYAGRIDDRKGLATLIDAVGGLPACTLRIVGDGDGEAAARLRERAAPHGERVVFEPGVDRPRLAGIYAEADVVAFPVEWAEPWGLVPLEAMAVGRPVVATGRGGSGEYLEHERNALLFEAGDAAGLRAAIERLAADGGLRERLREGGFATAQRLTEAAWTAAVVAEHEALSS